MSWYAVALFLHVIGAIGTCVSLGVWLVDLAALRRVQSVEQVRALAWLAIVMSPVMVVSVVLLLAAGLAMALGVWGLRTSWIAVALGSLALIAPVGPLILDARMRTILAQAGMEPAGPVSDTLAAQTRDPVLATAAQTLAALLLGIVFLMTAKPPMIGSIFAILAALTLGLLSGLPFWRAGRARHAGATADPYLIANFWTRRW